jgi:hypothetical protein
MAVACTRGSTDSQVRVMDFVTLFERAELRPDRSTFQVAQHTLGGVTRATIAAPVPSRAIWVTALPRRASLSIFLGVPSSPAGCSARLRFGVSDDRIYEALASETPQPGTWSPIRVDLSRYAGRKFSIFYQPEGRVWRLVFSADQVAGESCTAFWAEPAIETDVAAARLFKK